VTGATVTVGGTLTTAAALTGNTQLTVQAPAGPAGLADVVVTNLDGQSATLTGGYTYTSGGLVPGFGNGGVVTSNPSWMDDQAFGGAVHDGTFLYAIGWDSAPGDIQWRIEKRDLATGALHGAFGNGGVVQSNPSPRSEEPYAIVRAGTALIIVGSDRTSGTTDIAMRIEKRDSATGALDSAFGIGGVVQTNPTQGQDSWVHVCHDGTWLYLVGWDEPSGAGTWRIRMEKRLLATGALDQAFGTAGVVISDPSTRGDWAMSVVLHGGWLYVAGTDEVPGPGDWQWRVEKRAATTGALDPTFGTGGVVTSNPSAYNDDMYTITTDGQDFYLVGTDESPGAGLDAWRIEKRSLATGALVTGFGNGGVVVSDPSVHDDEMWGGAVVEGGYLYIPGYDRTSGDQQWRLEKRSATTGALVPGFGTNGVVQSNPSSRWDRCNHLMSDGTHLYVMGFDLSLGTADKQWRIEKRTK
jgi:hypothetical protein